MKYLLFTSLLSDALCLPLQALWVYLINVAFSALAVLHLTYLGSVFNSSVDYVEEDEVREDKTVEGVEQINTPALQLYMFILAFANINIYRYIYINVYTVYIC